MSYGKGAIMKELLQNVYKRRSVRRYSEQKLTDEELTKVEEYLHELKPLIADIKVEFQIVPCSETNCKFNAEYCLLVYSEEKNLWLTNVGYMLEQWDLYLTSLNIGVCWYGMGKVEDERQCDLVYAIMLSFGKCDPSLFRNGDYDFNRVQASDFWKGMTDARLGEIVRLAPSAVNSQPWRVEQADNKLNVYRQKGKVPILSNQLFKHWNKVDMGIFLCFLDIALENEGYTYTRTLGSESDEGKRVLIAEYVLDAK